MRQWLDSFQFHVDMTWYLFAAGMLLGLLVALIAVSYHAVKAARINPADSLKYE
jgi:putative ABC transport system permease protein